MPTLRQKRASKIVENRGTMKEVMEEVGYAPATIKNPKNLTESKAWPKLVEEKLPDEKLLEVHNQGLEAVKIHGSLTEPDRYVPDIPTRLKALELGYKVKGRLSEGGINVNEAKILVIPGELMKKYGITSDTKDSSK